MWFTQGGEDARANQGTNPNRTPLGDALIQCGLIIVARSFVPI